MSQDLEVDPAALDDAGTTFGAAGDGLAGLDVGQPFGDAAAAVPQLQTATACMTAQTAVTRQMTAAADAARTYRDNVDSAVRLYESGDATTGEKIASVRF